MKCMQRIDVGPSLQAPLGLLSLGRCSRADGDETRRHGRLVAPATRNAAAAAVEPQAQAVTRPIGSVSGILERAHGRACVHKHTARTLMHLRPLDAEHSLEDCALHLRGLRPLARGPPFVSPEHQIEHLGLLGAQIAAAALVTLRATSAVASTRARAATLAAEVCICSVRVS